MIAAIATVAMFLMIVAAGLAGTWCLLSIAAALVNLWVDEGEDAAICAGSAALAFLGASFFIYLARCVQHAAHL